MKYILACALCAIFCQRAAASVFIGTQCDGDSVQVDLSISYAAAAGVVGLNIEWAFMEDSEQRTMVLDQPIVVGPTNDQQNFVVRFAAPTRDRVLRCYTYFTDVNGVRVAGGDPSCSYYSAYVVCGAAFQFRAKIFNFGEGLVFDYCDGGYIGCGGFNPDLSNVPDLASYINTGRLVNAYGEPGAAEHPPCAMPLSTCGMITRMEFENDPAGCEALRTEYATWGAIKATYR